MKKFILNLFPLGIVIILVYGVLLIALLNEIRSSANNPQIEVAEDAINLVQSGVNPITLFASKQIDIEQRLKTFQIIYNNEGKVVGSNALLDNEPPIPPQGVFDYARENGENRITWEPKEGVRIAAVVKRFEGKTASTSGFVLAGRSLEEVEKRQRNLIYQMILGCVGTLLIAGAALWIQKNKRTIV